MNKGKLFDTIFPQNPFLYATDLHHSDLKIKAIKSNWAIFTPISRPLKPLGPLEHYRIEGGLRGPLIEPLFWRETLISQTTDVCFSSLQNEIEGYIYFYVNLYLFYEIICFLIILLHSIGCLGYLTTLEIIEAAALDLLWYATHGIR